MQPGGIVVLSDYVGAAGSAAGGAGVASLASYRALCDAGVPVRLVTGFPLPADVGDADARSLGGADLRGGGRLDALQGLYNPTSRSALAPVLAALDPDRTIILLHQWTRYLTPSAIGLLRRFPVMIYMHDYFWACPNGAYFDFRRGAVCTRQPMGAACIGAQCDRAGYAAKLARIGRHALLGHARRSPAFDPVYLHISHLAQTTAMPLLPKGRHEVIHNPMTPPTDGGRPRPRPTRDIGYFGRLEPEKGIAALLDGLVARGASGLFVGDGALAGRIDATPGMTRLPWQPASGMTALMQTCRAVALPSLWQETWGLVVPEAMVAGVPVLVSERAGSSELVERFGGGALFDPSVDGSLALALDRLLSKDGVRPLAGVARAALLDLLSPGRHAATIASIAADTWGIDLGGMTAAQPTMATYA